MKIRRRRSDRGLLPASTGPGLAVDIELTEAHGHAQRGASRRVRRGGDAPATTLPRVAEERSVGAGA